MITVIQIARCDVSQCSTRYLWQKKYEQNAANRVYWQIRR